MASDMQSERNRENFYIAFIFRHNFVRIVKFRKEIFFRAHSLRRDMCFVQFLTFLTKVLSAKVTKFARFYKQKFWGKKSVMPVGVYWAITDRKLTNQSARTIAAI